MTLDRFVDAQEPVYTKALAELRQGAKRSHWMWFVFPQLAGLGRSPTAQHFGLHGPAEAREYLAHPLLGARLRECAHALLALGGGDPVDVLGLVDALKLRSSMTLFAAGVRRSRLPAGPRHVLRRQAGRAHRAPAVRHLTSRRPARRG